MGDAPLVIIGTGLAGYSLARELRRLDPTRGLHLVTADGGHQYAKPMISNALAKGQAAMDLPMGTAEKQAEDLAATIWTRRRVTGIDPGRRRIALDEGELTYGQLVLALGADPVRLPLADDAAVPIESINDLDDYARFRARIDGRRRVAILGAGLIGCEFANDLAAAGYEVEVIEPFEHSLGRFAPSPPARALERALAGLGVVWRFGVTCTEAAADGDGVRLRLSNDEQVRVDAVLSAVGLEPRTRLARDAGLAVDRGIVVDRYLRTSSPEIHALGDCMQVEGLVLPFVMPIVHGARALAKTLTGDETRLAYPAMPVVVKTPAHPVAVSPPAAGSAGGWQIEESTGGVKALFRGPDGRLLGFTLTGMHAAERGALAKELPPVLA